MRLLILPIALLAAGCTQSDLLRIDTTPAGVTGARAAGQFPNIQATPRRAARQLDARGYSDIAAELNAEADVAGRRGRVDGRAADARARALLAEAEAEERRRRMRIRDDDRVPPASMPFGVVFNREDADG